MLKKTKSIGPGVLIAAAFIGPGTVTVCTLAGVQHGFTLLWATLLSIVATIVLQEMTARLGLIYKKGLASAVKNLIPNKLIRFLALLLILSAILVGNAAYEAGNISGGVLGWQSIFSDISFSVGAFSIQLSTLAIGLIAFVLLFIGQYKTIEKILVFMVILMSLSFIIAAVLTFPNMIDVLTGIFIPRVPEKGWVHVIALVGTTVVPYNLFLHASIVREKWKSREELPLARRDTILSIALGGLVSIAIMICAAAVHSKSTHTVESAADLGQTLAPLYGHYAQYLMGFGLFAAGITSTITAALAAAYVTGDVFGWKNELKSSKFRSVWGIIIIVGLMISSTDWSPIAIIQLAQFSNGLLLPIIACFLLWVVNRKDILGHYKNNNLQNIMGSIIIIASIFLGLQSLLEVFK